MVFILILIYFYLALKNPIQVGDHPVYSHFTDLPTSYVLQTYFCNGITFTGSGSQASKAAYLARV